MSGTSPSDATHGPVSGASENGAYGPPAATGRDTRSHGATVAKERVVAGVSRLAELHAEMAEVCRELAQDLEVQLDESRPSRLMDAMHDGPGTAAARRPLLTAADLAQRLSVDQKTVRRWRAEGKLPPAVELGSSVLRWESEVVDTWLAERRA